MTAEDPAQPDVAVHLFRNPQFALELPAASWILPPATFARPDATAKSGALLASAGAIWYKPATGRRSPSDAGETPNLQCWGGSVVGACSDPRRGSRTIPTKHRLQFIVAQDVVVGLPAVRRLQGAPPGQG